MAGVIAQSRAIVSSANARILVTLITVPRFATTMNESLLSKNIIDRPESTAQ